MATDTRIESGFYCSTSGTYFVDKESLAEHYKSDFHRYNLKRKVAGLPPVTKEWFESRKAQLSNVSTTAVQKIWYDPLTRKKFSTENTYQAHVRSKKYQDLVKKSGQPAPEPVIMLKKLGEDGKEQQQQQPSAAPAPAASKPQGYKLKPLPATQQPDAHMADAEDTTSHQPDAEASEDSDSGWETASDADMEDSSQWDEWDVCRSLFDSHVSPSMEANLEYMFKHYGFYLPDAQYLKDPEGLLKYLGAKLQYGKVPLYSAGSDESAKQFRSLHAVQRHMVDTNQCKMVYEDNEEEYEDFYDYSELDAGGDASMALVATAEDLAAAGGYELVVAAGDGGGSRVLGTREFSKYYRQRHKPVDGRQSVAVNTVIARYRSLGIDTSGISSTEVAERRVAEKVDARAMRSRLRLLQKSNKIRNLPNNVPY